MAGTASRTFGPVALSASMTTNIYNQGSALLYDVITQIHVVNKTASDATFSLWLGATGANAPGTEILSEQPVAAHRSYDWHVRLKMTSTDFLVGGASGGTTLTILGMGEKFVV